MSWLQNSMNHTITYWPPGAPSGFGPGKSFGAPVTVKARWEDSQEIFFDSDTNRETRSESLVFTETDLSIGGYMFNGVSTSTDPTSLPDAVEIRQKVKYPSFQGDIFLRKYYMTNIGTPLR